jgi:tetratricopeptide (TPR) repeat protein
MPPAANFDSLLVTAKNKLAPAARAKINELENTATESLIKEQQITANETLADIWQHNKNAVFAAHYYGKMGQLENSEKRLTFAARLFAGEMQNEQNPNIKQWIAKEIIDLYQQALSINPNNDTSRIGLADAYINGAGEPMKGIEQLLTIVRRDSTNIPANVILGKLAVESGQLDKAIMRGNIVLSVDKNNVDAYLFMGEAYKQQGKTDKAKECFTQAKNIVNTPEFSKEIDDYINSF